MFFVVATNRCNYYKPLSKVEFCSANYQFEFLAAFQSKLNVAYQLIQKNKCSLSSTIDDAFYGGIGLLINTTQNKYRTQNQLNCDATKSYNFYKDSNIPEVYNTAGLLDRIEARVSNELQQWPDHAVLSDVSFAFHIQYVPGLNILLEFFLPPDNNDHWSNSIARHYRANCPLQYWFPNIASKSR